MHLSSAVGADIFFAGRRLPGTAAASLYIEGQPRCIGYTGGLRSVGFHCAIGRPRARTASQSHPPPWRPGSKQPLARAQARGNRDSSAYSISTWKFAFAAAALPASSPASRTRMSSTGYWLILPRRNRRHLPGPRRYRRPGRQLPRCLFSRQLEPCFHRSISRDAIER